MQYAARYIQRQAALVKRNPFANVTLRSRVLVGRKSCVHLVKNFTAFYVLQDGPSTVRVLKEIILYKYISFL